MSVSPGLIERLKQRLFSTSICARVAIGTTALLVIGAIAGTLATRRLAASGVDGLSLAFIILAGVSLLALINYWIVRAALQPLIDLGQLNQQLRNRNRFSIPVRLRNPDPETCRLAEDLSQLASQVEVERQQWRAVAQQAIHAQEEERKRMARWLHDDTGQALISLALNLERLESNPLPEEAQLKERLAAARKLANDALAELRKNLYDLRPSILDDLGLAPAIRWYANLRLQEAGIAVQVHIPHESPELPPELRTSLFRIAQEAINNIARHSHASHATITLDKPGKEIYLRVEDDGCGFQPPRDQGEAIRLGHWGLVGIQERVELVGGSLSVTSEPGKGALLEVYIPFEES